MTELNESGLLEALEVNMNCLEGAVMRQSETIRSLRAQLEEKEREIARLEEQIATLQHGQMVSGVATTLARGAGGVAQARKVLSDIIKEVEYCISQIQV